VIQGGKLKPGLGGTLCTWRKQNKSTWRIFKYDILFKKRKPQNSFQEIEYFSKNASKK